MHGLPILRTAILRSRPPGVTPENTAGSRDGAALSGVDTAGGPCSSSTPPASRAELTADRVITRCITRSMSVPGAWKMIRRLAARAALAGAGQISPIPCGLRSSPAPARPASPSRKSRTHYLG